VIEPNAKPRPLAPSEVAAEPGAPPYLYIWADVLAELRFNGQWRNDRAAVGVLVGHVWVDPADGGSYVEVEGYVANAHLPDASSFTRHLRQSWREVADEVKRNFGDASVLGWYAAVPGHAPASQGEWVLHNTFFPLPWHTGLWMEPNVAPMGLRAVDGAFRSRPVGVIGTEPNRTAIAR
jgi:hypothetical protein